ncbi:MAG: 4-(cytidine 5'-diphospho)-2-C-methyl-D-erythritol kinase [Planctomycetes bacterium]|nr:4-(cytidine 5'-diphospho)-2-C-methyl-D-erythritol kinase [Planctomycetota bacterium]
MIFAEKSRDRVVLRAPAKLNLYLEVLGKRPDGFHEIETVMHAIDLCDVLTVERVPGEELRFAVSGRPCPADDTNLVVRAAEALFSALNTRSGLAVNLQKIIPLGAGLGGGSADAGAMLAAVNHLLGEPFSKPRLEEIAAGLGSDVPFFLTGGTAVARGRGERIEALVPGAIPRFTFVLFYPGAAVSTAVVYGTLNLALTKPKGDLRTFLKSLDRPIGRGAPEFQNALAVPFRRAFPELAALQDRVSRETGLPFCVTGSGSAMFAAVADRAQGVEVMRRLLAVAAGEIFLCESLPG